MLAFSVTFIEILSGKYGVKWVMMNQDTRRLQKVSDDVRDEFLIYCPQELR
ncbi:Oleoyl-acyl carrier protein thioesterase 1, chloroplastic [Vitis vinifera]|uniref:Acyl-[acyl-carrier-protein] hydrolase n=1 Tax=Vitis vinifera TaxID=29760 RepID=A0A438CE21_VITVI|nr:Oleoyl-acyl carrier protein thioesterase 1, chloroplastic [Vitis vinifera]